MMDSLLKELPDKAEEKEDQTDEKKHERCYKITQS